MNPYKGIENRLDKIITALEQLVEVLRVRGSDRVPAPALCGARHGKHECDLPAGHKPSYQHQDSRQPPGYESFML